MSIMNLTLLLGLLGLALYLYFRWRQSKTYEYGTDHRVLNRVNARRINAKDSPPTMWLNMGYWADITDYVEACRAMARLVWEAAGPLPSHPYIFDFGYGCGDQLLFWLEQPNHPERMDGITLEVAQAQLAHGRVMEQCRAKNVRSNLYIGNAAHPSPTWRDVADSHAPPVGLEASYDLVVSLDALYHFHPRSIFLTTVSHILKPHGRFSGTDLLRGPGYPRASPWTRCLLKMALGFASVPTQNLYLAKEYAESWERAGFENVVVTDITHHVFFGLRSFVKRQQRRQQEAGEASVWTSDYWIWVKYEWAGRLFEWLGENELVQVVGVSATRV
ncbi:S-adenosyl-L-methionine-dependent methyltransferase [Phlyctochytrium arcticum]|nr:S-adenosyl-L-methionine-dependent methyltransferase [Phlyctochytrium arcticum]